MSKMVKKPIFSDLAYTANVRCLKKHGQVAFSTKAGTPKQNMLKSACLGGLVGVRSCSAILRA